MQFTEVYAWATDTNLNAELKKQVATAVANAAVQVLSESKDTPEYDSRQAWANSVLASEEAPLEMADKMIWGVLGNVAIQAALEANGTVADNDIQFVVNALIGVYS